MGEEKPLRLFVAVDPPPRTLEAVERGVGPWRERIGAGRWVPRESWHVTMRFLGRTTPGLVSSVEDACAAAARRVRPFRVSVEGLGVFPSERRARVFWVGLRDREGGLTAMARALDEALAEEFPPEKRAFTPHLTVARFQPFVDVSALGLDHARIEAEPFEVRKIVLYRSHLSPKGARYEALREFGLRG